MSQEYIELSRRLIASKHWRWMPGMATYTPQSYTAPIYGRIIYDENDINHLWRSETIPNLKDPATLGCLLALVREAWGEDTWVQHEDEWTCWVVLNGQLDHHVGATEAEALVAALEAAP